MSKVLGATVLAINNCGFKNLYHVQNMSHLDYFCRMFPRSITAGFGIPIRKSLGSFLTKREMFRYKNRHAKL